MPIEQNISLKGFLDKNFVLNDQIKKNNIQKVYTSIGKNNNDKKQTLTLNKVILAQSKSIYVPYTS